MMQLRIGRLFSLCMLVLLIVVFFLRTELAVFLPFSLTGYAALVNGEPISIQELNAQHAALGSFAETLNKTELLDQLITEKLLLQKAQERKGVTVSEEEVEAFLKQNGPIADREHLRVSLLLAQYLNQTVLKEITVSDEDVEKYYTNNTQEFIIPKQVHVAHILVKPQGKTEREVDDILQHILDSLKKGESFEKLAGKYSEDEASRVNGGDLGYIYYGQTVPAFDKVAFSTPINETSVTFRTPFGFHILKIYDQKQSKQLTLDEIKDKLKIILLGQKQKTAFVEHTQKLREQANVRVYFHE